MSTPCLLRPGQQLLTDGGDLVQVREWRGEGSYARLYLGELVRGASRRACAVKLARTEVAEAAACLAREDEALRRAGRGSTLVERLGAGQDADAGRRTAFLALEWIEGHSVRMLVERQRRLPLVMALSVFGDVAAALSLLHAAGVAHGDVRSDNVLALPGCARAVLIDRGAARLRGEATYDAGRRADLRGLAGILHLMLTGEPDAGGSRLSTSSGHHSEAVALYRSAGEASAPDTLAGRAATLLDRLRAPVAAR